VSPWLELCRDAVEGVRRVLAELPTRREREPVLSLGAGGDEASAIDLAAEQAVVALLERVHGRGFEFTLVSEELGERRFGDGARRIVVDPIDGSVNAKRGLPHFALSLAVAEGPTMDDVVFGYVFDFGSGEEWRAVRGEGAWLADRRLGEERPKNEIEILCAEGTTLASILEQTPAVVGTARRLRVMGSLALALCNLAAGRVDAVCSLKHARSVDIAAAQLLVRECNLAIELFEAPPLEAAPLDVEGRSRVVAAATPGLCAQLAAALSR
jgi:myo-inositol-1(or 4)-monophosphatase